MRKKPMSVAEAARRMGMKGGKATGPSKARTGTAVHVLAWWSSPAGMARRRKPVQPAITTSILENPQDTTTT